MCLFKFRLVTVLVVLLGFSLFGSLAYAETPEQYCENFPKDIPDRCYVCGNCVAVVTQYGTHECKKCPDDSVGSCQLTNCKECSKYPDCVPQ